MKGPENNDKKAFLKYSIADQIEKKHTDKHQHKKSPNQIKKFAKNCRGPEEGIIKTLS